MLQTAETWQGSWLENRFRDTGQATLIHFILLPSLLNAPRRPVKFADRVESWKRHLFFLPWDIYPWNIFSVWSPFNSDRGKERILRGKHRSSNYRRTSLGEMQVDEGFGGKMILAAFLHDKKTELIYAPPVIRPMHHIREDFGCIVLTQLNNLRHHVEPTAHRLQICLLNFSTVCTSEKD